MNKAQLLDECMRLVDDCIAAVGPDPSKYVLSFTVAVLSFYLGYAWKRRKP